MTTASQATITLDRSTSLAVERTWLAYERTMMAWIRTATSLISFGFTIYKFFQLDLRGEAQPDRLIGPAEFALIMIATGLAALAMSTFQHVRSLNAMRASSGPLPTSVSLIVAGLISVMGLLALATVILQQ